MCFPKRYKGKCIYYFEQINGVIFDALEVTNQAK